MGIYNVRKRADTLLEKQKQIMLLKNLNVFVTKLTNY